MQGKLRKDMDALDVLEAAFPAGTHPVVRVRGQARTHDEGADVGRHRDDRDPQEARRGPFRATARDDARRAAPGDQ